ncbi:transcription factor Spt20 homolog isoform 2-T5 [Cochliomyia hominivorax]
MQSLDSSCQEADFIINDTLKKLKGSSNSNNTSSVNSGSALASNNPTTAAILRQQPLAYQHLPNSSTTQQPPHKFQQYHQLQSALQGTNVSTTAINIGGGNNISASSCTQNVSQQQLSPPAPPTPPSLVSSSSFSVTFPPKSSLIDNSLLHCNISQIPSQPPLCIFEDDEEPTNPTDQPPVELLAPTNTLTTSSISNSASQNADSAITLDNIVILTQPTSSSSSVKQHIPLTHPSPQPTQSTTYSNFNSITSPSPIVPDLLLSTPPGSHNFGSHNNNHNNNNKKADKRPSSSTSSSTVNHHHTQHHHQHNHLSHNSHLLPSPGVIGSPTSSPNKRQKIKDVTSTKSSHSPSVSRSISSVTGSCFSTSATNTFTSASAAITTNASKRENTSSHKFFNIHERIKDHYLQLLANDLNLFAEAGFKQRTRSFILERVVESERLNTIVINLYPGNKGYALALFYDDRQIIPDSEGELTTSQSTFSSSSTSTSSVSLKNISSRGSNIIINNSNSNSSKLYPSSIPPDLKQKSSYDHLPTIYDGPPNDISGSANDYSLVEVLRWPYENDQLLQCIDREVIPDFLMDMLAATTITLQAPQDDSTGTPRVYSKPNVFYAGCVVAQIRDFRQTFATSTNICDTRHVLLRPTNATLFADVQHVATTLNQTTSVCAPEDKLALESQIVLATAEPLCLDPDPNIGRHAINSQHERQLFNTHELRRQMKKYTQISINRKRKIDQFTHHYGLELCDYLARLRNRPRTGSVSTASAAAANISATNGNINPLVSATMLTSFASKVPKRPKDVIRPIRPPRLDYPTNLKVPDQLVSVEKYAKTNERPRETTDCQPQLIEEYILETERDDNEGRRVVYHIKLSIFQRPSNSEYLGELYVDRDYREGSRNGESCRFPLGTRVHANRYIQQFTEIFTEEGRKAVKITHLVPGHLPKITHTGITPEQRQALLLQQQMQLQQQRQAALLAAQQQQQHQQVIQQTITQQQPEQQQQQQHLVVVGPNGQQQHLLPSNVQHLNTNTMQNQSQTVQQQQNVSKNINIVNVTGNSVAAVQHVLRQQQLQQQQQQVATTQFIDANGTTVQLQHATLTATSSNNSSNTASTNTSGISGGPHHIQLQQITSSGPSSTSVVGVNNSGATTTTHQLSLSNGSLVLVQQHLGTSSQTLHQQQAAQALQHAGITIQPASSHQQQKAQVISTSQMNNVQSGQNSALRTQLSSNVPILQAQLKAAPIVTNTIQQQQLVHKQNTANSSTNTANIVPGGSGGSSSSSNTLQANPAISAIVTSIMNSANQWQQQQQQQNSSISNTSTTTTLKSSSNASILSLLNSAPAAMTSTPVASGTFTTSTGQTQQQQPAQQQNVTLVQHSSQQQQTQTTTVVAADNFVQTTQSQPVPNQSQRKQNEVLQNLLNPGRKINIVSSSGPGNGGTTATFRTNAAGNLIAVNLNQPTNHPQQQQNHHQQQLHLHQQHTQAQQHQQDQPSQTTVRVSMSALASQLASPPAIMTNSTNFGGYTLSTVSGTSSSGSSIKILNSGIQQQRVLANALRRDSLSNTSQGPPNAIVVGVAAPSPGSDSNASNASGFAVPQATSSTSVNSNNSTTLNALLANAATPSPSGSEHSQSSQNQNLLERLNSGGIASGTGLPNMSPQQQHHPSTPQQQYITKSLVQSPATSSIHSPMSSPHPQTSPSPHLPPLQQQQQQPQQQQPQQQQQQQSQTATLNLQGINFSTLQGAMANFPGLQNVQVQIPGFNQPISLQLTSGSLHAVQQPQQSGNSTVSVVTAGGSANSSNSSSAVVTAQNTNSQQQTHQQRSLLVSVPVSSANQQQGQAQHTITLQPQQLQQHHASSATSTVVNIPAGAVATTTGGTQTVVLTNNTVTGVGNSTGTNNTSNTTNTGTTMLTLPIAQLVGSGVQKLNSATLRTSGTGPSSVGVTTTNANTATGGSIIVQQQHGVQQQQKVSHQPQQATITVSSTGTGNQTNQAIQLVGTIQQGGRNIQVVGTKQLTGSRQLITQRQIGGSTLKIAAAAPINANTNTNLTSSANLTATPIVMSTQKLQLKTIKASSQHQTQQQQHQRILNQITASQASQTTTPQQTQTVILGQQTTLSSTHQQSTTSPHTQQQQHIQIQARSGNNLTQRTISAIAIAKQQQQQQAAAAAAAAAVAAANRRRPATDNKNMKLYIKNENLIE